MERRRIESSKKRESKISSLREEIQTKHKQKIAEMDQLKSFHSNEVEQLRLQVRELNTHRKLMKAENEAEVVELKAKAKALEIQVENYVKTLLQEREESARQLIEERKQHDIQLAKEKEAKRKSIANYQNLQSDLSTLKSEVIALQEANSQLHCDITEMNATIQLKDASRKRKDSELEAKGRALEEKDAATSAMSERITKTTQYLTAKQQVSIVYCMHYSEVEHDSVITNYVLDTVNLIS